LGYPDSQNNLGYMYEHGIVVKQDYNEAFKWYSKAAENGSWIAQRNLGMLYWNGLGTEKNIKKAFELLHSAAESGNNDVYCILGRMYLEVNEEQKGIEYLQKAIQQGDTIAKDFLDKYMQKKINQ
jgi:TPR repeat protein